MKQDSTLYIRVAPDAPTETVSACGINFSKNWMAFNPGHFDDATFDALQAEQNLQLVGEQEYAAIQVAAQAGVPLESLTGTDNSGESRDGGNPAGGKTSAGKPQPKKAA